MPLFRQLVLASALGAVALATAGPGHAGEVRLKTGGRLTGKVEQIELHAKVAYRITTTTGTVVEVTGDQVHQVVADTPQLTAYQARAMAAPDTPEGQLALAKWCQSQHLLKEYERHTKRVLELDPQHAEARSMLNFRNVDGEWQTRDQVMESRGLVWYEGKWRTRQDIALREYEKQQRDLESKWSADVKRWYKWLTDRKPERVQQAMIEFGRLSEPLAAKAVVDLLENEKDAKTRLLLAKAAARIDHQLTVNALVKMSLEDPEVEIRIECLESLVKARRPGLTTQYVKALKSKDNVIVNRAATALAQLGDPSAVSPLIDALVTEHTYMVGGNPSGGDTYSVSPSNGTFGFGGGRPKAVKQTQQNPDALTALVRLTGGENFGYAKEQWRGWLAAQAKNELVDLRRDP
jgi:hypothetical protein